MLRLSLLAFSLLWNCCWCVANVSVDERCEVDVSDVNAKAGSDITSDVAFFASGTPWVLRPLWPVTPSKLPSYLLIVVCVWLFIGSSLRVTRTEQDEIFEERRARQVLDQVAQVFYEHWKVEVELHGYEARDMQMQELARQRISEAGGNVPADVKTTTEYQEIIVETGFVETYGPDNPMPVRLTPKRLLDALMDEIDQCPVSKVAAVLRKLKNKELHTFALLFREAHRIMLVRTNAKLDEVTQKTREARAKHAGNAAYSSYTSGSKLLEVLDIAKDLKKMLLWSSMFQCAPTY
jgi:hypothetical protein